MSNLREANTIEELEVLFFVALRVKASMYENSFWIRARAKLGLEPQSFIRKCVDIAKKQLTDVMYNYPEWEVKYGKNH